LGVSWTPSAVDQFANLDPTEAEARQVKDTLKYLSEKRAQGGYRDVLVPFGQLGEEKFLFKAARFQIIYSSRSQDILVKAVTELPRA